MVVAIPKLRIKCGPEGPLKIFETFPDSLKKHSTGKKRGPNELEDVQAKKKQKLDCVWSAQCLTLLKFLIEHRVGWPFTKPVDPVELNIPDYFSIVSKPMDLGTVKSKLLKNEYGNADEFAADVRLTFANAILYNPPGNPVHKLAKEIKEIFEVRWEHLKKKTVSKSSDSKRQPAEVDCSGPGTAASSKIFSVGSSKPSKQNSKMLRTKKPGQDLGVSSSVKIPAKGSAQTAACKCGSSGRIICICLKSCSSSGSEVSSLTDCQGKKSSGSQASKSDPQSNDAQAHRRKQDCQVKKSSGAQAIKSDPQSNDAQAHRRKQDCQGKKSSGSQASKSDPQTNDETFPDLRTAISKAQSILKAKHKNVPDKNNKSYLVRLLMEKEEMERTLCEEKARIEAEITAAKFAARMRAKTELKQKRERQRLELEEMKQSLYFEENNHRKMEKDFLEVCGSSSLREIRLLFEKHTGLTLRNDEDIGSFIEDLEEGEII